MPTYRLHAHDGDDLGLLEHPAPNLEPGDVVLLADGREALVTARVEAAARSVRGVARGRRPYTGRTSVRTVLLEFVSKHVCPARVNR